MTAQLYKRGDFVLLDDDNSVIISKHEQLANGTHVYEWFVPRQKGSSPQHLVKKYIGSFADSIDHLEAL